MGARLGSGAGGGVEVGLGRDLRARGRLAPSPPGRARFVALGKGCEPPQAGGRRGWGRMDPAESPRPAPASQDAGSFVCGFPLSRGLGKCLFGERTVLNLVFKTAFFSPAKRVRMNVRKGKSALPLLPPADRSRLELV